MALIVVMVVGCSIAESQTQAPENTQPEQQAQPTQQPSTDNLRGTPDSPLVVEVLESPQTPQETARIEAERQDEAARWWTIKLTGVIALFTFCLVIVGGFQVLALFRQHDIMRQQADIANTQAVTMQAQSGLLNDTLATNREIERAYMSMTHRNVDVMGSPDGHDGFDVSKPIGITITIVIRNTGRTPGDFLGGYFGYSFGDKPATPDVTRGGRLLAAAFLLPGKEIDLGLEITTASDPSLEAGLSGATPMWLVGVVDYEDRFGGLHQGGYARRYSVETRNFVFSPETNSFN